MTPYKRGYSFELRTMKRLEEMGAVHVSRTAGSHTPVDVYAWFKDGAYWFCQCKSGKTKISRKDRMQLVDLAHDCGAVPVVVTRGLIFEVLGGESGA